MAQHIVKILLFATAALLVSTGADAQPGPGGGGGGLQPLPPVPVPPQNPITENKRVLGKILFWDEQLSSDNTMACGTCHIPAAGGSDPRFGVHPGADGVFDTPDDVLGSPGVVARDESGTRIDHPAFGTEVQVTGRAAPSNFTALHAPELFWDGRASSSFTDPLTGTVLIPAGGALESQALGPILSSVEMAQENRSWNDVTTKLEASIPLRLATDVPSDMEQAIDAAPNYPALFAAAFGDEAITPTRIAFAMATYQRTLVADETPWDRFAAGDTNAMTAQQIQGWDRFNRSLCDNCHRPPLFTDNNFHNIGLRPAAEDEGRRAVTGQGADFGDMKTSSLRAAGLRSRLMHTGTIVDVRDSIDFYVEAGGHVHFTANQDNVPPNGAPFSDINIPGQDRAAVADFIANALTDPRVAAEEFPFDRPTLASERGGVTTACAAVQQTECTEPIAPGRARLRVNNDFPGTDHSLQWKWTKGGETDIAEFGDPTDSDALAFCVYDGAGAGELLFEARLPAGGSCGSSECWKTSGNSAAPKGYKFSNRDALPDGITRVKLKAGAAGKAKIDLRASGANLDAAALGFLDPGLPLPLVAQLQSSTGGCWQAAYSAAAKNADGEFDAR